MAATYTLVYDAPARFQFDNTSGTSWASASFNCGPACATRIADYYRNSRFGIEQTRRLVTGCCKPTTGLEQSWMLDKRGVPSTPVYINSVSQMHQLVGDGNRPIIIGVYMARVPASVRDHPFTGWHAICVLGTAYRNGARGFWVNDPNFSAAGGPRPDPDRGKKFYSDQIMQWAFIQNPPHWAIVPNRAKPVTSGVQHTGKIVADGDPNPMRYRNLIDEQTGRTPRHTLKRGKAVRKGAVGGSGYWAVVSADTVVVTHAFIQKEDLPIVERKYGDVYLVNWYQTNGHHLGYIKGVDLD